VENYHHIVWVTHNSRISERMIIFKVSRGEALILSDADEVEIANYIFQVSDKINIKVCSINICKDHIHMLINANNKDISQIMKSIKGKTTHLYKKNHNIDYSYSLWAQKYFSEKIKNESHFTNVIEYIENNRNKHELPRNIELEKTIYRYKDSHQMDSHQQGVATPCFRCRASDGGNDKDEE